MLLDVYETVLTCDFERHFHGLADEAGVDFGRWSSELEHYVPALVLGQMSITEAFTRVLKGCGIVRASAAGEDLAGRDVKWIIECSTLFPDALPSIRRWRSLGVKVALVSNCVANTRPLLDTFGLCAAVDATVLSCEVGSAKPAREIYLHAVAALGVTPEQAVFVDDQPRFCVAAEAVGMQSMLIDRTAPRSPQVEMNGPISTLLELDRGWTAR